MAVYDKKRLSRRRSLPEAKFMTRDYLTKILIVAANPKNTEKLRLDEEVREIQTGLERSKSRHQFQIISRTAVRPDDLRRALLDYEPQIVHFSGHGVGTQGLVLLDDASEAKLVSAVALARLFKLFAKQVKCVLLNACYSQVQAEAICQYIDYVIGMDREIGDRAAIKFAVGFYDAIAAGRSIEDAYEFGCSAIALEGLSEALAPVLKKKGESSHDGLHYRADFLAELNQNSQDSLEKNVEEVYRKINKPIDEMIPVTRKFPHKNIINHPANSPENYFSLKLSKPLSLEQPEGQVPLDSLFYIDRPPIEQDCYETIRKPGALIRIKAPRQMGKSSLMSRILHQVKQEGYQTVELNFQSADADLLSNLDLFLQWFCVSISEELNLPDRLDNYWKGPLGSKNKCTKYFQKYLLTEIAEPLVLGLDEVDQIFQHPEIATDFFGLLRAWHERGKNEALWKNLRLAIAHSKEVYIPLNINQSPFNVGLPIELPELTPAQVADLVQRHQLNWSEAQIQNLMTMVGGHPYLVRVALYQIAKGRMTLGEFLQIAPTEAGPYYDHLRRHLLNLEKDPDLVAATKQVMGCDRAIEINAAEAFKLRSMGLVKFQGNAVMPLGELYRQYFSDRLQGGFGSIPSENIPEKTCQRDPVSGTNQMSAIAENMPPTAPFSVGSLLESSTLAAIVFTDVVNSTAQMVANQQQMLELLKRDFDLMREICQRYGGRVLKCTGDGLLIYFDSAVKAVACSQQIQKTLSKNAASLPPDLVLEHRIGVHLGDVFFSGDDVFGAGVNLAARLQSQANPGGICISETVYEVIKNHLSIHVTYIGPQQLKGIPEPVRLYQINP
ncbi:AAA-like domain-containing protein [Planktothricoides raciborskii]|uniref:AAA-like domain-containing protein n=1 Tax=Planktothricoides raciborskii GIHE-MW2 TaxID=2792601 RepID=A0AAU8JPC3_9CYAN